MSWKDKMMLKMMSNPTILKIFSNPIVVKIITWEMKVFMAIASPFKGKKTEEA